MSNHDLQIEILAGNAQEAADAWTPYQGPAVEVKRIGPFAYAQVSITTRGPVQVPEGEGLITNTYLTVDMLDELVRNLLAVRADLVKL